MNANNFRLGFATNSMFAQVELLSDVDLGVSSDEVCDWFFVFLLQV